MMLVGRFRKLRFQMIDNMVGQSQAEAAVVMVHNIQQRTETPVAVAKEGFDIGASLDIASLTLMAKWRHKSRVHAH